MIISVLTIRACVLTFSTFEKKNKSISYKIIVVCLLLKYELIYFKLINKYDFSSAIIFNWRTRASWARLFLPLLTFLFLPLFSALFQKNSNRKLFSQGLLDLGIERLQTIISRWSGFIYYWASLKPNNQLSLHTTNIYSHYL